MAKSVTYEWVTRYGAQAIGYTYPPGEEGAPQLTEEELSLVEPLNFRPRFSSVENYNKLKEELKDNRFSHWGPGRKFRVRSAIEFLE